MEVTGERFIPNAGMGTEIELEHMHRYHAVAPLLIGRQVLDAACGVGYGSHIMAEYADHVTGIDISAETVAYARKNNGGKNIDFCEMSIAKLDFPDDSFDAVISFETIEHVPEQLQRDFLAEVRRVLKKNGFLIVSTPDLDVEMKRSRGTYHNPYHIREYGRAEFQALLETYFPSVELHLQERVNCSCITGTGGREFHGPADWPEGEYLIAICGQEQQALPLGSVYVPTRSRPDYRSCFYLDYGSGYSEAHKIMRLSKAGADCSFSVSLVLPEPEKLTAVRFDPCDFPAQISLSAEDGEGKPLSFLPLNRTRDESGNDGFLHGQPFYELRVGKDALIPGKIAIHGEIFRYTQPDLDGYWLKEQARKAQALSDAGRLSGENGRLTEELQRSAQEIEQGRAQITVLQREKTALEEAHAHLKQEKNALEEAHAHLKQEKNALEEAYAHLKLEKSAMEKQATDLTETLQLSRKEAQLWAAQYSTISNAQFWKMTAPMRKLLDNVKRTGWGGLLFKGLSCWHTCGFWAALRKAREYFRNSIAVSESPLLALPSVDSFFSLTTAFGSDKSARVILPKTLASYENATGKKILLLSHELNLTGGPVAVLHLAECLKESGYLPVVVSPYDGVLARELEERNIPALVCPQLNTSEVIRRFANLFDVIFANTIVSAPAVMALYGFSKPVLWWIHEAEASYTDEAIAALPEYLPENIHVYAGGAYAKARLLAHCPEWPVGELLYNVPDLPEEKEPFSLPAQAVGKTVFACIGMLEQRKGQELLVEAVERLPEELALRGYFIFVGRQYYEPNYRRIMELSRRYPGNVQYIQELPMAELRRLYHRMDCLVCSSRDDPMPIVVTEALAASRLVICSEHTGSAAILREDQSGLVYGRDDPAALAGCITQVLEHGGEMAAMRAAARKSYEMHFSRQVFEKNVLHVLGRVLEHTGMTDSSLSMASLIREFHARAQSDDLFSLERQALTYDEISGHKRVLLISHELSLTGAPIVLQYLAESLRRADAQVLFASPADGLLRLSLEEKGIPTLVYSNLYYDDFLTHHAEAFDLIVLNTVVTFRCVERLHDSQTPVLWWIHDSLASYEVGGFAELLPRTLPKNVKIFCGGEYARDQLLKFYPEYSTDVLYYASPDEAAVEAPRYEMHRDGTKFAFAVIGQQDFRKGHDVFAEAIGLLPNDARVQSQFYFIGQHMDKTVQAVVDGVCAKYPENVFYIPQVNRSELLSVYRQCPCIICSSRDDPLPVFVTEAMMMSDIVICSEHTGSAPILEKEDAGFVYHNDAPAELAAQMCTVLAAPERCEPMRQHARKAYEAYFSQSSFDGEVRRLVASLIPARPEGEFPGTVSVVIPAYNAGVAMEELLHRLFTQTGVRKIEVVVIDSGSTDGTPTLCRERGAVVVEIPQSDFSHSHARNLGAKTATGDILLFMTQDALPRDEHWMQTLIAPIISKEAAAVSCREQCPEGTDLYYQIAAWNHAGFLGIRNGDRLNRMDGKDTLESLRQKASLNDVTTAVDAAVFSSFLYRFSYAEDLDLGLRLLKSGYAVKLLSSTCSIHGHDRLPGYYLKRAYVEAGGLGSIEPGWGAAVQIQSAAAGKVVYGAGLLSRALETVCEQASDVCGMDVFIRELQDALSDALRSKETSEYLSGKDEMLRWCLETLKPYGSEACPGDEELIQSICYYLDAIVRPYLSANGIVSLSHTMQESLCDCLVKQFCLAAGVTLAGIPAAEPLYESLQILSKGV